MTAWYSVWDYYGDGSTHHDATTQHLQSYHSPFGSGIVDREVSGPFASQARALAVRNPHPGNNYYVDRLTGTIQRGSIGKPLLGNFDGPFNWGEAKHAAEGGSVSGYGHGTGSGEGGLKAIGDFFQRLTQENTWIRVGEFAAGALLLYAGVKALMQGTAVGNAVNSTVRTAKKAAVVIPK
jgi:hypothetical protein